MRSLFGRYDEDWICEEAEGVVPLVTRKLFVWFDQVRSDRMTSERPRNGLLEVGLVRLHEEFIAGDWPALAERST